MVTTWWNPNAQNTAMVFTFTGSAVANAGTWSLTAPTGKTITYTMTASDTIATAIAALLALLSGTTTTVSPEFAECTFASPTSTTITITANNPGTPISFTKGQSGGATCTLTTTTANVSESDAFNASNWLRNNVASLPQNGDDVIIANSAVPILWNVDLLSGVLLNSFTRYQSFTGTIGLPEINPLGYIEWRPTYFKIGSNVANFPLILGTGSGAGPTRERYDMQSYRYTATIIAAGSAADDYSVRLLGSNGLNYANIVGVSVGVAMLPSENVPNGATLNGATVDGGGLLDCGPGCAFSGTSGGGTLTIRGGSATLFDTPTILASNGATVTLSAQGGTYASVSAINGVQLTLTCAMTISVLSLLKSSTLDNSGNLGAVTITTSTIDGDTCQVLDGNNGITWTNATTINGQVTSGVFVFTGPRTLKLT